MNDIDTDTTYEFHKYRKRSRPVDAMHNIFNMPIDVHTERGWFNVNSGDWLVVLKNEFDANPIIIDVTQSFYRSICTYALCQRRELK